MCHKICKSSERGSNSSKKKERAVTADPGRAEGHTAHCRVCRGKGGTVLGKQACPSFPFLSSKETRRSGKPSGSSSTGTVETDSAHGCVIPPGHPFGFGWVQASGVRFGKGLRVVGTAPAVTAEGEMTGMLDSPASGRRLPITSWGPGECPPEPCSAQLGV